MCPINVLREKKTNTQKTYFGFIPFKIGIILFYFVTNYKDCVDHFSQSTSSILALIFELQLLVLTNKRSVFSSDFAIMTPKFQQ